MQKFTKVTGKIAYLPLSNIDTDMIIPKQYLKTIKRSGLGKFLFADSRYDMQGNIIPDYILNKQPDSKILVAGDNFGCGSSREHAPWAILDFGIRAVISPNFADIFYNNCFKNGILPLKLKQEEIDQLVQQQGETTIDLDTQTVQCGNLKFFFDIDPPRKKVLLEGLDDIEKVMKLEKEIATFEQQHAARQPWLQ